MKKTKQKELRTVAVRLPENVVQEIESLKERVQKSPEYYGKVSVSTAALTRMALLYGLETIKEKYGE